MNKPITVSIALLIAAVGITLMIVGHKPKKYIISEFHYGKISEIKGFTEGPKNALNPDSLAEHYKQIRSNAKAKASMIIKERNNLNFVYHTLCILAIITSLVVSYLGATKGVVVEASDLVSKIDSIKKQNLKFRKVIIFLSILSLVLTTASNRVIAYYDNKQNQANEVIDLIKNADLRMTSSINLNEVANVISSLELDIEKY